MTAPDSLTHLERRAWRSTFDDGLFDFLLGGLLLLNWLGTAVPDSRFLYPFFFGLAGIYVVVKRLVVAPRAGVARFAAPRRQRKALSITVLLVPLLLGLALVTLLSLGGGAAVWIRTHPTLFQIALPVMIVLVFSALASLLEVPRVHVIGLIMAVAFAAREWFDGGEGFLAGGLVLCVAGVVFFLRFLRHNPPLTSEERAHAR